MLLLLLQYTKKGLDYFLLWTYFVESRDGRCYSGSSLDPGGSRELPKAEPEGRDVIPAPASSAALHRHFRHTEENYFNASTQLYTHQLH